MSNAICDLLKIDHPIILGGMLFVGRARLVGAVSETGGLGLMGAGAMDEAELREEIRQVRQITDRPFGLNIPVRSSRAEMLVDVAIQEKVAAVSTSAGDPFRFAERLKSGGISVIHVVPTVAHALRAESAGVDAVVAEGSESGGYINPEEVTTLSLVPQVVDAVKLPVVAAGGIADARGLAAALALGAAGVQLGTRFLATHECDIADDYKHALILARDTDTVVVRGNRAAHRDLKSELIRKVSEPAGDPTGRVEEMLAQFETSDAAPASVGARNWAGRSAGQSAGLVREILSVKGVIEGMMNEAREIVAGLGSRLP